MLDCCWQLGSVPAIFESSCNFFTLKESSKIVMRWCFPWSSFFHPLQQYNYPVSRIKSLLTWNTWYWFCFSDWALIDTLVLSQILLELSPTSLKNSILSYTLQHPLSQVCVEMAMHLVLLPPPLSRTEFNWKSI